jgi:hypothetical protein
MMGSFLRRLIMLFLFQGCFGLSFKKWTGFQDFRIYRIDCFKLNRALTMDRILGFQDLQNCFFEDELGVGWTGFQDCKIVFLSILKIMSILSILNVSLF